jgi:hypothetical protein
MSKKIIITGKRNIEAISSKKDKKRVGSEKWNKLKNFKNMDMKKQIELLNRLYLDEKYEGKELVQKEVQRKLSGYKNQDTKKNIYDENYFITYYETLEKLVISKLKCYYCRCECKFMYENTREKKQWTLDRIDNDEGHNKDNVVICCLECNLKKGTMDDEKFKFAKQMRIIKKY